MKIAVFKYLASKNGRENGDGGECINAELIESEINDFCEDKEVIDIKVNTVEWDYDNIGNDITLVYTIMYK